jgi:hypothetical protein
MGIPVYMEIEEAYSIVQWHSDEYGHCDLFGALNSMEENWDDLDSMERSAYKMIKRELEKEILNKLKVKITEDDGQPD